MNKIQLLCVIVIFSLTTIASAKDVLQVDVSGVKLGMSPDEVATALKAKYKVADNKIQRLKFGGSPHIKGNYISSIILRMDNSKVRVAFGVVPPVNKAKPVQAENIEYTLTYTPENYERLKKAAIKKYGQPTSVRKATGILEWCSKKETVSGVLGTIKGCKGNKPYLKLGLDG